MQVSSMLTNTLWVVYTRWKGNLHNQFQCAQTHWDIGTPRLDRIGKSQRVTWVQEISINHVDSGESFDRKTTTVDICFAEKIADTLLTDHDPRSIVECQKRSDQPKWKDAIQQC